MFIDIILLISLTTAALWTVMTRSLLRSGIGLALASAILAVIIFRLGSPLAAVFELSVCAGLISVLFVSTISLTNPLSKEEVIKHMHERLTRFWFLPLLVIILGIILSFTSVKNAIQLPDPETIKDVRVVLWSLRPIDILGQIIILLTGVFGVIILFKERVKK